MRMAWSEIGAATVMVSAACIALYFGVQRSLRRAVREQQAANDRQIAALAATVKALQARVAELNRLAMERAGEIPAMEAATADVAETAQVKPEMLAVITAAATTFLGKAAHIRSAKLSPTPAMASAWTQQGRMIVQASHNLRQRD